MIFFSIFLFLSSSNKVFLRRENSNRYAKVGIIAIADVELHEALNFKDVKRNNHYTRLIFKSSQKKIVK